MRPVEAGERRLGGGARGCCKEAVAAARIPVPVPRGYCRVGVSHAPHPETHANAPGRRTRGAPGKVRVYRGDNMAGSGQRQAPRGCAAAPHGCGSVTAEQLKNEWMQRGIGEGGAASALRQQMRARGLRRAAPSSVRGHLNEAAGAVGMCCDAPHRDRSQLPLATAVAHVRRPAHSTPPLVKRRPPSCAHGACACMRVKPGLWRNVFTPLRWCEGFQQC